MGIQAEGKTTVDQPNRNKSIYGKKKLETKTTTKRWTNAGAWSFKHFCGLAHVGYVDGEEGFTISGI